MMYIHWYPGHMTKALRMMKAEISLVDCVVYVLDARAPLSSVNPSFDDIIGNRPRLYVLNKCDLVPQNEIKMWIQYFERDGHKCVTAVSISKGGAQQFLSALTSVNAPMIERYRAKGVKKTVRAMVIGVPNCGKSTLINSLIAKKRTVTGDKPGVTRGKQWVSVAPYIDLLDTPGTLYPDFSDQKKATNLAMIGSIKEDILDLCELAVETLEFLKTAVPKNLKERYKLTDLNLEGRILLAEIAKNRGYVVKGGEIDEERTAKAVILDFRRQAFGKILMEHCND